MKLKRVSDPRGIRTLKEVGIYLDGITEYETETGSEGGVLVTQRTHSTPFYEITSSQIAVEELNKPVSQDTPEFGIKFYSRRYFLALRERLSGNEEVELPEPERRKYR